MTTATEADDLEAFVDALAALPQADAQRMRLHGCSQGGFVSTMVATRIPERIRGLALMYPAFVLHDDEQRLFPSEDDIPETCRAHPGHGPSRMSRAYNLVARATDPYALMDAYAGEVPIVHGDADVVVTFRYSQRAEKTFPHARLIMNEGGTHGFTDDHLRRAFSLVTEFFKGLWSLRVRGFITRRSR